MSEGPPKASNRWSQLLGVFGAMQQSEIPQHSEDKPKPLCKAPPKAFNQ